MAVGTALGIKQDIEVGAASFDGLFAIEGDREVASRLLTPAIRSVLLVLARFDVPTLEIDPPAREARVAWQFEPTQKAFELAARVLLAVRELDLEVQFLR